MKIYCNQILMFSELKNKSILKRNIDCQIIDRYINTEGKEIIEVAYGDLIGRIKVEELSTPFLKELNENIPLY